MNFSNSVCPSLMLALHYYNKIEIDTIDQTKKPVSKVRENSRRAIRKKIWLSMSNRFIG